MVGFQQALEFQVRLVVKGNRCEVVQCQAGFVQYVFDCLAGKGTVVLFARKAFLVSGSHDLAIQDQCGSTVVVKCRQPQNCFRH